MFRDDQEVGDQRHQLPGNEEAESIVRHYDDRHREQETAEEGAKRANGVPTIELGHVAERIDRSSQTNQRDGQHEKRRQGVEADRKAQIGNA